jgi:hypothetical protein
VDGEAPIVGAGDSGLFSAAASTMAGGSGTMADTGDSAGASADSPTISVSDTGPGVPSAVPGSTAMTLGGVTGFSGLGGLGAGALAVSNAPLANSITCP